MKSGDHLMVYIAAGLLVFTLALHVFYPSDKLTEYVAVTCAGFLFGKWTNGFGRKPNSPDNGDNRGACSL